MTAPYAYADPTAPTLEEATAALTMANTWRSRYEETKAAAIYQQNRADQLEAELAGARDAADESEREAIGAWEMSR